MTLLAQAFGTLLVHALVSRQWQQRCNSLKGSKRLTDQGDSKRSAIYISNLPFTETLNLEKKLAMKGPLHSQYSTNSLDHSKTGYWKRKFTYEFTR